jgi:hypothetical protein
LGEGKQNGNESVWIINNILPFEVDAQANEADTKGKDLLRLKNDGNTAFQQQKYAEAAKLYTSALVLFGETERALLSNWGFCCLSSQAHLDAIAASAASLRIRPEAKAFVRLAKAIHSLGQPELCVNILEQGDRALVEGSPATKEKDELLKDAKSNMKLFQSEDNHFTLRELNGPKYLPRWIGNIETFDAGLKGRGVRAAKDLEAGELVLLEPPLASASMDSFEKSKESLYTIDKLEFKDASHSFLCQAIMLRSQREAVLSRIVDCLFDGTNARPLTSLDDLMPNFSSSQAFLPTHHEYYPGAEKVGFNSDRIDAIVSTNSHGTRSSVKDSEFLRLKGSDAALYPAVSMFNHSAKPNCYLDAASGCAKVIVNSNVKAGEELSICYHPDENVVRRVWLKK